VSKVYIAGKINGLNNYREIFKEVEDRLITEGNVVMNPAVLGEGFNYEAYMPICLAMLEACDTVFMLNNWKDSKGAKVEHEYAKLQGKKIIYQEHYSENCVTAECIKVPKYTTNADFYRNEGITIFVKGKFKLGIHPDNMENNIKALNDGTSKIAWDKFYSI